MMGPVAQKCFCFVLFFIIYFLLPAPSCPDCKNRCRSLEGCLSLEPEVRLGGRGWGVKGARDPWKKDE